MLTGLTLGETPLSPAPGASSLPPASTKKPLKDGKQGKPRRAKKGEKTVDRHPPEASGIVTLKYIKSYKADGTLDSLLWRGGIELHQMSIIEPTPEAFLKRAQEIFPGWDVRIEEANLLHAI